jgi:signal transduction histidine kinase
MDDVERLNCWEALGCGHGPGSEAVCPAATDTTSDGVNGGLNAGRICWTVPGTLCSGSTASTFVDKLDTCLSCDFLRQVKADEGDRFCLIKLGQGVRDAPELHATISHIQSFLRIPEQLYAEFDLRRLIDEIAAEAQQTVRAERSVVFLIEGSPPVLSGELCVRGERIPVTVALNEESAVGSAAVRNEVVNVRDPYRATEPAEARPPFNEAFDRQCNVRTHSLLAVPIRGSDGDPIGVITAANCADGVFSADDQWFMGKYALQVGLAVEKAQLLEDSLLAGRVASFGETMAGLSHSLKGITHALRGLTYIIRQGLQSGRLADIEAACEILDRQVQRVVKLSVSVAAYDLARSGGPARGELNEIVADVVSTLGEEASARAIRLETQLDNGLRPCTQDRLLIYRCLVNLLSHAFDSCPASGGRITVATAQASPGECLIEVSDNGPRADGDRRAELAALSEDNGRARGIGLPTAVRLLREHGGRLEVSGEPGPGTTYRMVLPLSPTAASDESESPER